MLSSNRCLGVPLGVALGLVAVDACRAQYPVAPVPYQYPVPVQPVYYYRPPVYYQPAIYMPVNAYPRPAAPYALPTVATAPWPQAHPVQTANNPSSAVAQAQPAPPAKLPESSDPAPAIATSAPAIADATAPAPSSGLQLNGGASFYLLRPFFQNNVAYSVVTSTTTGGGTIATGQSQTNDFNWQAQPAFDVSLGLSLGNGFGLRSRYFHMNGDSEAANTAVSSAAYNGTAPAVVAVTPSPYLFNGAPGAIPQQNPGLGAGLFGGPSPFIVAFPGGPSSTDRFSFQSFLRIDALDLELTGQRRWDNVSVAGGIGGRYLQMKQGYNASLVNLNTTGAALTESLDYSRTFQGGGPTISGQASWSPFSSGFSVFASGRGSLVVGQTNQLTAVSRTINDPNGSFSPVGAATVAANSIAVPYHSADTMPIVELELGFEYAVRLRSQTLFVRVGAVDQTYFGAGNASRPDGNLSLLGFQTTFGINY